MIDIRKMDILQIIRKFSITIDWSVCSALRIFYSAKTSVRIYGMYFDVALKIYGVCAFFFVYTIVIHHNFSESQ